MKTDISIPNEPTIDPELVEMQIIAEFNAWEAASDEALENFEKGLEKL
ncbi:MAG: hypothetical protein ABI904_21870 [Chloroflexota bacterium]